jgi:hypothetical protein
MGMPEVGKPRFTYNPQISFLGRKLWNKLDIGLHLVEIVEAGTSFLPDQAGEITEITASSRHASSSIWSGLHQAIAYLSFCSTKQLDGMVVHSRLAYQ